MIDELEGIWKEATIPVFLGVSTGKPRYTSVRIARVPAEIRTDHPGFESKGYSYANLLGRTSVTS
jgi:hypothetical protein